MNGSDSFFVDTNVLLYYYDRSNPSKYTGAQAWVSTLWSLGAARTSRQVLHEFYANAVRKLAIPASEARAATEEFCEWGPSAWSIGMLQRAWHWCDAAQLNFWDALILAAAEQTGCRWLLSEDFQAGRRFDGLTVVNPFEQRPSEFAIG